MSEFYKRNLSSVLLATSQQATSQQSTENFLFSSMLQYFWKLNGIAYVVGGDGCSDLIDSSEKLKLNAFSHGGRNNLTGIG